MTSASAREQARKAALDAIDAYLPDDAAQFVSASTLSDAAIDAYEAALKAAGYVMVPNGRRANRDNPEGKGSCTLDMLHAGMAVMSPARRAAVSDRDDAGNLVGDVYRAMIEAATNPAP